MEKKSFRIFKWVILSLAILANSFIIAYSSLSADATQKLQDPFTNFFVKFINSFSKKEAKNIPLESIKVSMSDDQYNNIPGYSVNEIPLGSAKEVECEFTPNDATNKAVEYSVEPVGSVILNQSGSKVSIVGMQTGISTITAKSKDGNYTSSVQVNIVESVAPASYEISLESTQIALGTTQTLNFDIDGGVLDHNELINFRYYDIRKLTYVSENETVATVDENGVIYPHIEGTSKISVSNGDFNKEISITVIGGTTPVPYTNLNISGDEVCFANDMILNQNNPKYQHPLTIKDGGTELDPNVFIWTSSNELLVKVDRHGVVRGFRKSTTQDETAVITAKSKVSGQTATFNVTVKNQLPNKMSFWFKLGDETYYDSKEFTFSVGDIITVHTSLSPFTQSKAVTAVSSDPNIISVSSEGDLVTLHVLKEGKCNVDITSVINPDLSVSSSFTVMKAGAIGTKDIPNLGVYIRKSIGHAAVFMICQVFTFLAFYMFLSDKKWWFWCSLSLGEGLFVSGLSELIQYFVPTRTGALIDILIDFSGVIVGFGIALLIVLIIKNARRKTLEKNK